MDHIEQLKKIRSEAIARMRTSPDFQLAGKLGQLIVELGETIDDDSDFEELEEPKVAAPSLVTPTAFMATASTTAAMPNADEFSDLTSDKMIDELVAEIEEDAAELDAIMAADVVEDDESDDKDEAGVIGPFLKPDTVSPHYTNGASHQRW